MVIPAIDNNIPSRGKKKYFNGNRDSLWPDEPRGSKVIFIFYCIFNVKVNTILWQDYFISIFYIVGVLS